MLMARPVLLKDLLDQYQALRALPGARIAATGGQAVL